MKVQSKAYVYSCDGCSEYTEGSWLPASWETITVRLEDEIPKELHLCSPCAKGKAGRVLRALGLL